MSITSIVKRALGIEVVKASRPYYDTDETRYIRESGKDLIY